MSNQPRITLVNGTESFVLPVTDRGLAYGDGLFETIRVIDNKIPLFEYHLDRFQKGVQALQLGSPSGLKSQFTRYIEQSLKDVAGHALIKVIVTRGSGGRGYTAPDESNPNFVIQVFDLPEFESANYLEGVSVKLCAHRLAHQSVLAGIKHLNRLDQVLASQELENEQEGLVFDTDDNVIEGIKSNLIIFEGDDVVTPRLDRCGVRGTLRQYLISNAKALGFQVQEQDISRQQLLDAQGAVLVNSLFGCWPVKEINGKAFSNDARCGTIQQLLADKMGYPKG